MHRVMWKLKKLSFFEKSKLSIAIKEKCKYYKGGFWVSKFNFEFRESWRELMHKIYSN